MHLGWSDCQKLSRAFASQNGSPGEVVHSFNNLVEFCVVAHLFAPFIITRTSRQFLAWSSDLNSRAPLRAAVKWLVKVTLDR